MLRNLIEGGFTGSLYAVNRHAEGEEFDGVPVHAALAGIADPVDLAVVAVPAGEVPAVVAGGAHGVQGLVRSYRRVRRDRGRGPGPASTSWSARPARPGCGCSGRTPSAWSPPTRRSG